MLLVHHDDAVREYAYDRQSHFDRLDKAWDEAVAKHWTVVSIVSRACGARPNLAASTEAQKEIFERARTVLFGFHFISARPVGG
jgi:hypothetical protein